MIDCIIKEESDYTQKEEKPIMKRIEIPEHLTVWKKIDADCFINNHGVVGTSEDTVIVKLFSMMEKDDLIFYSVEGSISDSYEDGFYANEFLRIRKNEFGELFQEKEGLFDYADSLDIDVACEKICHEKDPQTRQGVYMFAASLMRTAFSVQEMQTMSKSDIKLTPKTAERIIRLFARGINKYFLSFIDKNHGDSIKNLLEPSSHSDDMNMNKLNALTDKNIKNVIKLMDTGAGFSLYKSLELASMLNSNEICEMEKMLKTFIAAKFLRTNYTNYSDTASRIIEIIQEAKKATNGEAFTITKFANYIIKLIVRGTISQVKTNMSDDINTHICDFFDVYWDYLRFMNGMNEDLYRAGKNPILLNFYPDDYREAHRNAEASYSAIKNVLNKELFEASVEIAKQYEWTAEDIRNDCILDAYKGFAIIAPNEQEDLIAESHSMNNCVKTYIHRMAEGTSFILFMRSNVTDEAPEGKSYITIELRRSEIGMVVYQAKRECNNIPSEEDKGFLNEWAKQKDITITSY